MREFFSEVPMRAEAAGRSGRRHGPAPACGPPTGGPVAYCSGCERPTKSTSRPTPGRRRHRPLSSIGWFRPRRPVPIHGEGWSGQRMEEVDHPSLSTADRPRTVSAQAAPPLSTADGPGDWEMGFTYRRVTANSHPPRDVETGERPPLWTLTERAFPTS